MRSFASRVELRRRGRGPVIVVLLVIIALAIAWYGQRAGGPVAPEWTAARGPRGIVHALRRAPWGDLYASMAGGIYASRDGGAAWHLLGRGFPLVEAWSVDAMRSRGGDTVLAAAGDGFVYRLARGHANARWMPDGPRLGTSVYALLALPRTAVVLAGSDRGIFRSRDGGRSWQLVLPLHGQDAGISTFARDPATGVVYAGLAGLAPALRVSRDGGRTWRVPPGRLPPPSVQALLPSGGRVYVGVMGAPGALPVWTGGARSYKAVTLGLPRDSHGMALAAVDGRGDLLVGTMETGVYRRVNGRWTRLGHGPGDGIVTALLVLPGAHPVVVAGTAAGIYRLVVR